MDKYTIPIGISDGHNVPILNGVGDLLHAFDLAAEWVNGVAVLGKYLLKKVEVFGI